MPAWASTVGKPYNSTIRDLLISFSLVDSDPWIDVKLLKAA